MVKAINLSGQRFGLLLAKERIMMKNRSYYVCNCDCGGVKTVQTWHLKDGGTISCGCYRILNNTKHGLHKDKVYKIWDAVKQRCTNKKNGKYHNYGGRGIKMCDRWINNPELFIKDMGPRPIDKHSIDRINNNGDYEPSNCRWATQKEQCRNQRKNNLILNIETGIFHESLIEASEAYGIVDSTLEYNLKHAKHNKTKLILL